ncbi:alpha/beta hydrolase [Geodermatophilus sp. URMC 62]|uniref:alpha/beta hydrolase n=1 Tax=Geodermatophilus sp. URMC 62 TaxID=3423414 RepID=UPI00406D26B9
MSTTRTRPTRRLLPSVLAATCAVATALTAACTTTAGPAGPPVPATAAAELPPGGVPGVPVPTIEWRDAGDGYQEATAAVPYDYADPGGRSLGLHLVRLPATDPAHRIGSLFVNFGGPGSDAAETIRAMGRQLLPPEVLARYDLVGADPRGTGQSSPVRCFDDPAELWTLSYTTAQDFPTTPAEEAEAVAQARRLADACRTRNGDLLDHVGTLPAARDLDVLRAALGDDRINLIGLSYGTFLGQVVANVFPDRVGALVLDSVLDPAWADGEEGSTAWLRAHSAEGSADTLQQFLEQCGQAGPQRCAFAADGDPRRAFDVLADRLRTSPLTVPLPGRPPEQFGYAELLEVTFGLTTLYLPGNWPALAQFLQAVATGDTDVVGELLAVLGPSAVPGFEGLLTANVAITCADTDNPADPHRYGQLGRRYDRTVAPYAGSRWAYLGLPCAVWQGHSTERHTGPWTATTAEPVLLVATRHDPATPYGNAVRVHDLLPNSTLLTVDGVGHPALLSSSCALQLTSRYLLTGATPAAGTVCPQDQGPFDPPA